MPLIVHTLSELLQNHPWLTDVASKDVWIQTDQMFGEIDQKEGADAHSDGCAGCAHDCGNKQTIHDQGAKRNPAQDEPEHELLRGFSAAINDAKRVAHGSKMIMDFCQYRRKQHCS